MGGIFIRVNDKLSYCDNNDIPLVGGLMYSFA